MNIKEKTQKQRTYKRARVKYRCETCGAVFSNETELQKHIEELHTELTFWQKIRKIFKIF